MWFRIASGFLLALAMVVAAPAAGADHGDPHPEDWPYCFPVGVDHEPPFVFVKYHCIYPLPGP